MSHPIRSANPAPRPRKPATDAELVERARTGARAAFEDLVERYTGSLFVYVLSRVANRPTAEDVVQEVFYVAFRDLGRLRQGERFAGWVFGMAGKLAARSRRSLVRESRALERVQDRTLLTQKSHPNIQDATVTSAHEEVARVDECMQVGEALGRLPDRYRVPLVLRYYEGLNSAEIGERLGAPAATVRSWLLRGNRMLRRDIEGGTGNGSAADEETDLL